MIRRTCLWVAALLAAIVMDLVNLTTRFTTTVNTVIPKLPRLVQFSEHQGVKRGHSKVLAGGGRTMGFALQLTAAVAVLVLVIAGASVAASHLHSGGAGVHLATAALAVMPMAGTFADPGSDLLNDVEGMSATDIQFVVDNTNPFEQLVPGGLLGDALFPARDTQELSFKYLKGAGGGAVMAHVMPHNSEAPLANRKGLATVTGEIPAIKQKRYKDALTLIRLQSADSLLQSQTVREIYDDITSTRLGVVARLEKMRMEALANGVATQLTEEGLVFSVDYGVPSEHKETLSGADLWSATTSTPIDDIEAWQNTIVGDTGHSLATAVTSSAVINAMRKHESVRKAVWGVNSDKPVSRDQLNEFLAANGMPTFIAYDTQVAQQAADGTVSNVRLFPANKITFLPAIATGPLGHTLRAPTAEEAVRSIADGVISIDAARIATHVYVASQDPKGLVTLAVASTFPSFERAGHVFQAQVLA